MGLKTTKHSVSPNAEDELDLQVIAQVIRDSWILIIAIFVIVLAIGIAYALLATPIYRATAMVQVDDNAGAINDKLGDIAQLFSGKAVADAEIELIRSRDLIDSTVRLLHLDIDSRPRYFPIFGAWMARSAPTGRLATPWLGFTSYAWGGEALDVTQLDVPPDLYDKTFTLIAAAAGHYALMNSHGDLVLNARVGEAASATTDSGVIRIKVASLVARPNTQFKLSRTSTQLLTERIQEKLDVSEKVKQSGIVQIQLDGADSARTAQTVNAIVQGYVARNVELKSGQAQQVLGFLNRQLPPLKANLDSAEQRYNTFRNTSGTIDLGEESKLLLQSIADVKQKTAALEQQRSELLQRFSPTHPAVTAINAQLADLGRQQGDMRAKLAKVPDTQQSAVRLMRDVDVNTSMFVNLVNNAQQLRVIQAGQLGNVHIVDDAVAQERPVRPKKALIVGMAALLGLVAGIAAAALKRASNRGMESVTEIEAAANIPVYSMIMHSERQLKLRRSIRLGERGKHVLSVSSPEDIAVEGIRSLRTALLFRLAEAPNNVVMITGPRPDIGKSFLSVNLAAVLASAGKRVLVIDADLRRGDVHGYFGTAREPGLHEVLSGAEPDSAVQHEVFVNLDVLPRGGVSWAPSELLMGERLGRVIAAIAPAYDVVLIDTPPVLAVTDSSVIGPHAGTTLFVMRHGCHSPAELHESIRLLASAGVTVDGILLTDVPRRTNAYGTYSSYATDTA